MTCSSAGLMETAELPSWEFVEVFLRLLVVVAAVKTSGTASAVVIDVAWVTSIATAVIAVAAVIISRASLVF